MIKRNLKKIWLLSILVISLSLLYLPGNASSDNGGNDLDVKWFNILPELKDDQITKIEEAIDKIGKSWWKVMESYIEAASGFSTSEKIASWIMDWSTITDYLEFIVKFLSQLGLVVWAGFIMFAWYKYMVSVFSGWKVPNETIKNAIIWILIVIFSYAIMKTLTSLVGIT